MSIYRFNIFLRIFSVLLVMSIVGCSATGPRYHELDKKPLNGKSEIVVYRIKQFGASGGCYRVIINDEQIGILASGGYLRAIVDPGKYSIWTSAAEDILLEVETKPDQVNYIQLNIGVAGVSAFSVGYASVVNMNWNVSLVDVPKEYGLEAVSNLRQSLKTHTCMSK